VALSYYSTNRKAPKVSFKDALIKGLAPDGGLYMPEQVPIFTAAEIESLSGLEYHEIAFKVLGKFLADEIEPAILKQITKEAYNFEVPLEQVQGRNYVMRLDRGPTASFKDFAARMMGRLMQHFLKQENKNILILAATSGDTGSAMASAFYGLDNVKVLVLFPIEEVSERQRQQMTTLHGNIKVLALDGKFDDCQALVKQAFSDPELDYLNMTSSNSINIGRLLPQMVYYFWAYSQLAGKTGEEIIFSVPSGNFGDLMGGMLAKKMGLPVKKFIVATNANDEFPKLMQTEKYQKIEPSVNCLSSAMNVGHPSNLARLVEIYGGNMDEKGNILQAPDYKAMRADIHAASISDDETKQCISNVYNTHKVLLEPHGAVGWQAAEQYRKQGGCSSSDLLVCLETAHPAKFPDSILEITGIDPELPESLKGLEKLEERYDRGNIGYANFKSYLKGNF
jgi:threonine synthase